MSSKTTILQQIRDAKPAPRRLPNLPPDPSPDPAGWEEAFREVLAASKATFVAPQNLLDYVKGSGARTIVSTVAGIDGTLDLLAIDDPLQLAGVDLAVLPARLGVAENGAMWVSEAEAVHRVLPFITQHLLLVLERKDLVGTMHEAYRRIDIAATGFGVFIAGPSKTADIEQSLVIGAHGPRSLVVCLR
ncbi:LutC/YkgG family protein [Neolewinella litorea]|uniref:LutC/YkgG family protein n=1 Tax=Neolewinella litorea TaxID=2562452 RepID=UPI001B3BAD38|nr:LUD domain-containing protein [Neolewinella litorea]